MKKIFYVFCVFFIGIKCMLASTTLVADVLRMEKIPIDDVSIILNEENIPISYLKVAKQYVYSLKPTSVIQEEVQISDTNCSEELKEKVARISYSGFNETNRNTKEWYIATQLCIWEAFGYHFQVKGFDDYEVYHNKIKERVELFEKLPSIHGKQITLKKDKEEVLIDEYNVLSYYPYIFHDDNVFMQIKGANAFVKTNSNRREEGKIEFSQLEERELGLPIIYGNIQDNEVGKMIYPCLTLNPKAEITYRVQPYGNIEIESKGKQLIGFKKEWMNTYEVCKPIYETKNIANVKMNIYAKEDIYDVWEQKVYEKDELVESIITNDTKIVSKDLIAGSYYVKEVENENGYLMNPKQYDVTIQDSKEVITHPIEHIKERASYKIPFQKTWEKADTLAFENAYQDMIYGIYTNQDIYIQNELAIAKDTLLCTSTINEDGQLNEIFDFDAGSYYVKELQTNAQYEIDKNTYYFDVVDISNGKKVNMNAIDSYSFLKRSTLSIFKTDKQKNPVVAKYVLYDEDKNVIDSFKTKKGKYASNPLIDGIYYLQEIETEKGYKLNSNLTKVDLHEDKELHMKTEKREMIYESVDTGDSERLRVFEMGMLVSMFSFYIVMFKKILRK